MRSQRHVSRFATHFKDMTWLTPREPDTYLQAAKMYRDLRSKGVTVRSAAGCIIARLAEENRCFLLARDRDMAFILESGLTSVQPVPMLASD